MSARVRIERYEALAWLVSHLRGDDFGGSPACGDSDPELFFPVSEQDVEQIAAAKQVCAVCPIRAACLDSALHTGDQGIWGGTTETERRALRAVRRGRAGETEDQDQGESSEGVQAA